MCGIFGWSFSRKSRVSAGQREVMANALAAFNAERGRDSWGIAAVARDRQFTISKGVGSITRAGGLAAFGAFPVVLGHTRAATVGAVTQRNAHPFETSKLILAHNGGIYNYETLNKKYERKCEVDSEHIIHHLSEGKNMSELEGYGAIEFLDKKQMLSPRVARLRNGQLSVRGIRNNGTKCGVVWSSSDLHLRNALDLAGLDHYSYQDPKEGQVYFAEAGRFFVDEKASKIEISNGFSGGTGMIRYRGRHGSYSDYDDAEGWGLAYGGSHYTPKPPEEGGYGGRDSSFCRMCTHYHSDFTGKCLKMRPDVCMCPHTTYTYDRNQENLKKKDKEKENSKSGNQTIIMLPNSSRIQGATRTNILEHPELGQLAEVGNGVYCRSNGEVVELDDATIQGLREFSGIGGVVG